MSPRCEIKMKLHNLLTLLLFLTRMWPFKIINEILCQLGLPSHTPLERDEKVHFSLKRMTTSVAHNDGFKHVQCASIAAERQPRHLTLHYVDDS